MSRHAVTVIASLVIIGATAWAQSTSVRAPVALKVEPAFETPASLELKFEGVVGKRLQANLENWELRAPAANPALTMIFCDRDRTGVRDVYNISGEYVGKYLCSSILSYRILHDPREKETIERVVRELIAYQGADGYLGQHDRAHRFKTDENWDLWDQMWIIRGFLMYYEEFNDATALEAAQRAADLIDSQFLNKDRHLTDTEYPNYAVLHAFTLLFRITGKPEYLEMAKWLIKDWDRPRAGQYVAMALAGKDMYEFNWNRWESVHSFLGIYEMYLVTGNPEYRGAFVNIWYSILKGDRHNTGGFTSGEQATGNPYNTAAIETCSTVAWIDMTIRALKLTGNSLMADELELSTFNGNLGGQSPSGSWWTYNTPMDGEKIAAPQQIVFQARAGSPELNCCSVNGPRGLGMVAEWAVMRSPSGVVLNFYGPSTLSVPTPAGQKLILEQKTDYPVDGKIALQLGLPKAERFELKLRIPAWSRATRVRVNGVSAAELKPGAYLALSREWKSDDVIDLDLDMSLHYWAGERNLEGLTSVYRSPILLAFDPAYNSMAQDAVPEMDARNLSLKIETPKGYYQPWILVKVKATGGAEVELCDFATAGMLGDRYRSWLPIKNVTPVAFDPDRPVWTNRPQ